MRNKLYCVNDNNFVFVFVLLFIFKLTWLNWAAAAAAAAAWKFFATKSNGKNGALTDGVLYPLAANNESLTRIETKKKKK